MKEKLNIFNDREKSATKHLETFKELVALQLSLIHIFDPNPGIQQRL